MSTQVQTYIFQGGVDLEKPYLSRKMGGLVDAINYEALPQGGYRMVDGYEKYDGRVTGQTDPAGSGAIRGVWVYQNTGYCIRDNAGGTAAVLFKADATSGWVAQTLSSYLKFDGGVTAFVEGETINGQTSGATAVVRRIARNSGSLGASNLTGLVVLTNVVGTFQDNENLRQGATVRAVADGVLTAHTLAPGGSYHFWNFNFLANASSQRMYAAGGVDFAFEWDGTYSVPILQKNGASFPSHIVAHSSHLFLGFGTDGILRNSSTGNPTHYLSTTGAADIGIGDAITNLRPNVGGVLFIACAGSLQTLYGDSSANWLLKRYSDHGGRARTMKEIGGGLLILDSRGVQRIDQTASFGDFQSLALSVSINRRLLPVLSLLTAGVAAVSKNKDQYRLFFGKAGYYLAFNAGRLVGITPVTLKHDVAVVAEGETTAGEELILFGDPLGSVFRMNKSFGFNGEMIQGALHFEFYPAGNPTQDKQYRKALFYMEIDGGQPSIQVRGKFDFDNGVAPSTDLRALTLTGANTGAAWDAGAWDTFEWASDGANEGIIYIDGTGQNLALSIYVTGSLSGSHIFESGAIHYSPRRLNR